MAAGTRNRCSTGLVKSFVACSKQIDSDDLSVFVIAREMRVLYAWIHNSEYLGPLRSESRPSGQQRPLLLLLVCFGGCGGHRERTKRPGQAPCPALCNKPLEKSSLKLGVFSNTTKLCHGFPCVELRYNFPFLTPASKLTSCRLEPFSRALPASNSCALLRNAAW